MEQNLLTAISSVGFPIVVTLYLLTSFQRSMDRFTAELSELVKELAMLMGYEALKELKTKDVEIQAPLQKIITPVLAEAIAKPLRTNSQGLF